MSTGPKFSSNPSNFIPMRAGAAVKYRTFQPFLSLYAHLTRTPVPCITPLSPLFKLRINAAAFLQVENAAEALARDRGRSEAGVDGLLQHVSE